MSKAKKDTLLAWALAAGFALLVSGAESWADIFFNFF